MLRLFFGCPLTGKPARVVASRGHRARTGAAGVSHRVSMHVRMPARSAVCELCPCITTTRAPFLRVLIPPCGGGGTAVYSRVLGFVCCSAGWYCSGPSQASASTRRHSTLRLTYPTAWKLYLPVIFEPTLENKMCSQTFSKQYQRRHGVLRAVWSALLVFHQHAVYASVRFSKPDLHAPPHSPPLLHTAVPPER